MSGIVIPLRPFACPCGRWKKPAGMRIGYSTKERNQIMSLWTLFRCPECGMEHKEDAIFSKNIK